MVAVGRGRRFPTLAVDLVGGCTVAGFVLVFLWLTLIRSDGTALQVKELTRVVQSTRHDLVRARATRDRLNALLVSRRAELTKTGRLPDQAPVEQYFQTLSQLAAQHRVRVVSSRPMSSRTYPGLFEQRYAYEVTGAMVDLTRFFQAIEDTDYWADVSFFKIDQGQDHTRSAASERTCLLTLSLFSALPTEPARDTG